MATFLFSGVTGTAINFSPRADVLNFDTGSAADLSVTASGTTLILRLAAESVTLLNVGQIGSLTTGNVTFADGSLLLVGDNTTSTSRDGNANTLKGAAGNDLLIGLAGNDTVDGRDGSDTYLITGSNDGTDTLQNVELLQFLDQTVDLTALPPPPPANNAPAAVVDSANTSASGAPLSIEVLANDSDANLNDTSLVVAVDGSGLRGTVAVAPDGKSVIYSTGNAFQSLGAGAAATDTFSYTMADAAGATSTATVTVTVNGATDGPTAIADSAVAAEDGGAVVLNVLANDTNDANPGGGLTISALDVKGWYASYYVIGSATGNDQYGFAPGFARLLGQASIAADGQSILYAPLQSLNEGEVGRDAFHYWLAGGSAGVVTITVTGVNDAPEAVNDSATVAADGALLTIDVLANDTDPDTRTDPPAPPPTSPFFDLLDVAFDVTPMDIADTKTVVDVDGSGLQGTVTVAAGGNGVGYTVGGTLLNLAVGQTAVETFSYTMRDSLGLTATATVRVTITGVNQAPSASNDTAAASENGAPVVINVLANDSDRDIAAGDALAIAAVNAASLQGSVVLEGASIIYSPRNAFQNLNRSQPNRRQHHPRWQQRFHAGRGSVHPCCRRVDPGQHCGRLPGAGRCERGCGGRFCT